MRLDAAKSEKPISCSHIVKKTIAFQGVVPTMPCKPRGPQTLASAAVDSIHPVPITEAEGTALQQMQYVGFRA